MPSLGCLAKTMITGRRAAPHTELPCYPRMSLKRQLLVGFRRVDSVTSLEDQSVETQAFREFQGLAGVAQKKDVRKTTSEARMSFRINTGFFGILQCH
jgi:hypothetical protein